MQNQPQLFISKQMRYGIWIVVTICLLVIFIPRVYFSIKEYDEISWTASEIESLNKLEKKIANKTNIPKGRINRKFRVPPCKFNPNLYSRENWMNLGLSEKQANVVIKFTRNGIHSNEELKKVYVIPDQLFLLIKDSTFYESVPHVNGFSDVKTNPTKIKIELNAASQEQLELIKGIGPFYAKNILNKRMQLGGFYCKEQLLEVWKMDEEKYQSILEYIELNLSKIDKINLNQATVEELRKHPYINWNLANNLIKMRENRNGFKQLDEIKESVLMTDELFEKLKHYLSL
jgi:competence protein ComEA